MMKYRFSFGPWNIHTGADPFGPPVRSEFSFSEKIKFYKKLGFDGFQKEEQKRRIKEALRWLAEHVL